MDFTFTRLQQKRLIYFLLCIPTIFLVYFLFRANNYWFVLLSVLLALIVTGQTFSSRIIIIALTGLVAICSANVSSFFTFTSIFQIAWLVVATFVCFILSALYRQYSLSFFIINLFAIIGATPFHIGNVESSLWIIDAVIIVIFFQIIFLFHFVYDEVQNGLIDLLQLLNTLSHNIFASLTAEYTNHIYLFERRIHISKVRCLTSIDNLRTLMAVVSEKKSSEVKNIDPDILNKLDQLFALLLSCAELRRRVSDTTIYNLCPSELKALDREVSSYFLMLIQMVQQKHLRTEDLALTDRINQLEHAYHQVLQITSREPLVFLIFINNLNSLKEELMNCSNLIRSMYA